MDNYSPQGPKTPKLLKSALDFCGSVNKKSWHDILADWLKTAILAAFAWAWGNGTLFNHSHPVSPPKPQNLSVDEARVREADCIAQKEKDIATTTQQRINSWAEYQKCKDEPRAFWVSAEEACKPAKERHAGVRGKALEAQGRTCMAAQ